MMNISRILLLLMLSCTVVQTAQAVPPMPCGGRGTERILSPEEKTAAADLVFEGAMTAYSCDCSNTQGVNTANCKATVSVTRPIKGTSESVIVFYDRNITSQSDFPVDCGRIRSKEYGDALIKSAPSTYYFYRDKGGVNEGTYSQVRSSVCVPFYNACPTC